VALNSSNTYDAADRLLTLTHQAPGGISRAYSYAYDPGGRLTAETTAEGTATYTYDNSGQLTGVGGTRAETYTYDSGGNRSGPAYTAPAGQGNELTYAARTTYTYDAEGNLVGSRGPAGTYDYRDRLVGVVSKVGTVQTAHAT